ncbi:MAG: MFS transporter [Steroidobacteraceae bacterium]
MRSKLTARLTRLAGLVATVHTGELRAVLLAFLCNFILLGSYYILRPVRDTFATVFGVGELQNLFTGTFVLTALCVPLFAALVSRLSLRRVLPGVFWFWLCNILLFYALLRIAPTNLWVAGAYYLWFSVANLFMISVFWSLMVDTFSPEQATRLFALIAAGGSTGAIAGPVITRCAVRAVGLPGLLLIAAAGFALVIVMVHLLMREKQRLGNASAGAQHSTLDHALSGNPFDGFTHLFRSRYMLNQAAFMLLMTWITTIAYFLQTDLVARTFSELEQRAQALADIDLVVNICSALVLLFGLARLVQRFGVTAGLVLNPILMIAGFIGMVLSPTLLMLQATQVVRRVSQYAIARPSREICFTVLPQEDRYKAKNIIDTAVYRFGDLSAAWVQAGLRLAGFGSTAALGLGLAASGVWGVVSVALGRRYESLRAQTPARPNLRA